MTRVLGLVLPELVGLTAADVAAEDALARGETTADEVAAGSPQRAVEESTRTLSLIEAGMTSSGTEGGFTVSPRRAAVLRWFSWRRNGFREAPGAVLLRKGAIWRELIVVPPAPTAERRRASGADPASPSPRLARVPHRPGPPSRRTSERSTKATHATSSARAAADAVSAAKADRTHRWLETQVAPGAGEPQADDATAFPAPDASTRLGDDR